MTEIQTVILQIFKEVDNICKKHSIRYYAIGGTCIGAVRHHGFIPWDDDLDIAIPIEDFDYFLMVAEKELPNYLYVYTPDTIKHYHYNWAKICDNRTAFIERSEYRYKDAFKGVFVDIMPISGVPKDAKKRQEFIRKLRRYDYLNGIRRFPICISFKSIFQLLIKFLLSFVPYNTFSRQYCKCLKNNPFYKSSYTGYTWSKNLSRFVFPSAWFAEGVCLPFEDTIICCPKDYHQYLSSQFGDYMVPPSIDKRQIHDGIIDLKESYVHYFDKL